MSDLKNALKSAGVPVPNRADRRKAEAPLRAMERGMAAHLEVEAELDGGTTIDEAVTRVVTRSSKGVRTVRRRPPEPPPKS